MQFNIDMKSEHSALFLSTQKLLLENHKLMEVKKTRITTYSDKNSGIWHMRTMKHGIDIGFLKGARMEDKYGMLTGGGKAMRVLPLTVLDVNCVNYYIEQAIKINAEKKGERK